KCTVQVGTAAELAELLKRLAPSESELAWNPELLREGLAVSDTLRPDRLVFGVTSGWAEQQLDAAYTEVVSLAEREGRELPTVVTDFATAELAKTAANAFLATKISYINAMAEMCEAAGGNVTSLAAILGQDPRIGRQFLRAGVGFGGGCLPKDIRAFAARAQELGVNSVTRILAEVDDINLRRRMHVVTLTRRICGGSLFDRRIAVLGAAFKPHSDDVRDSHALSIAQRLHDAGAVVTVCDPQAVDNARRKLPVVEYAGSADEAVTGADAVLLLTEWPEFRDVDPHGWLDLVAHRRIFDGRGCLNGNAWRDAGWEFHSLGQ
ncbi:MAG: UDP-glucose dehydrogenase family protein, partial [Mycobacteriales bacterium]